LIYEREALVKSFLLFFLTIEVLLAFITYLIYRWDMGELKNSLFLEMKNYSYTFEGEKFGIDVVPVGESTVFYEILEGDEGLYILVPVPGTKKDAIKILYPKEKLEEDKKQILIENLMFFGASSVFSLFLSIFFAVYSLNPLRRSLRLIEEVTRDIIHDLNTPLMTILVNLKILSSKYPDEEIKRALSAVKQLENLKENLRPLSTELEKKRNPVDVNNIENNPPEGSLITEDRELFKENLNLFSWIYSADLFNLFGNNVLNIYGVPFFLKFHA
jgi:two-component system OmpR family sensor kinase